MMLNPITRQVTQPFALHRRAENRGVGAGLPRDPADVHTPNPRTGD